MTEKCLQIVDWLKSWFTPTEDLIDVVYPVGSIYMSVNSTNPSALFGGTWEQIEDKFLLASGTNHRNGSTGGSADAVVVSHSHTQNEHRHSVGDDWSAGTTGTQSAYTHSANRTRGTKYTSFQAPVINATGEDGTGKNMPPYLTVNVWKRTA